MGTSSTHFHASPRLFVLSGKESGLFPSLPVLLGLSVTAWILAMLPVFHVIWTTWMTDPLRSIGMFFPVLSLLLIGRVWRNLGWERQGTWWGLLPLALTVAALWLHATRVVHFEVGHAFSIDLLPEGPILALSLSSAVLMLGGTRLFRQSLFPIMLLLLVNPVPSAFNVLLDLPLQHASAGTARHFATLIGERPDGEQLRLMFTPDFGMFIAPGCNGIRGAVTLGYIALITAYLRGFSIPVRILSALAGVVLGYLFNFIRLCLLVVYYKVGRFVPAIQPHGALIDYIIGGSLFLFASACFSVFFFRPTHEAEQGEPLPPIPTSRPARTGHPSWPAAAFLLVTLVVSATNLNAVVHDARAASLFNPPAETNLTLPQTVGRYHLIAQWSKDGENYLWGRYSDGSPSNEVSLGLWLARGDHDALLCHLAAGEKTSVGQPVVHDTPSGAQTSYRTFSYDDGLTNVFAASRVCPGCGDLTTPIRSYGPIQIIDRQPSSYFHNSSTTGVLITHEAAPDSASSSTGYRPLRAFIASLDESALITSAKK